MDLTDASDGEVARVAVARATRDHHGRLVALLAAAGGELDAAEDAVGDALERALRTWPARGVPDDPAAWLFTAARNRLRDRWRSAESRRTRPLDDLRHAPAHLDDVDPEAIADKRLELLLVCAHPDIPTASRTPLMLNTVLGFTAAQIATIFSVPTTTMATRLVRAKRRIAERRLPFEVPDATELPARMNAVLEAVYGAYVIEWSTSSPEPRHLPPEGLRLAEVLAELAPDHAEARGLAALVLLSAARAPTRADGAGRFVALEAQDPAGWNRAFIDRAHEHLRAAYRCASPGRFQIEAAIQAVHCARHGDAPTDWTTLRGLHASLYHLAPSHGSATALAAVVAETDGPAAGLSLLDEIAGDAARYQPAWATRASLLARLGRDDEADAAYEKAIALTHDAAAREHLRAQHAGLHLRSAHRRVG